MPDLIERSNAQQTIRDVLAAGGVDDRRGGNVAFLTGTAGIGKTAMLRWAAQRAREQGFARRRGVASPMEQGLPFGLLGQAIVALGGNPRRGRRRAGARRRPVGALLPHPALARRALGRSGRS